MNLPESWTNPANRYHCRSCDVYGVGDECWLCGAVALEWGAMPRLNSAAPGPDWDEPPSAPSPVVLTSWSTPPNDPMALYARRDEIPSG